MILMGTSRFFVSNLSQNIIEEDLQKLFEYYGKVDRIELKRKEDFVDPGNVKVIAFVTLNINENDVQYCVDELNGYRVKNTNITVSVAKESFLDRLKRERQEANQSSSPCDKNEEKNTTLNVVDNTFKNTRKKFAENSDSDEDIEPHLLITKKSAAKSLHNGKIVIQSFDNEPVHVIETKKRTKELNTKSSSADQKRKESLLKMNIQYKEKKAAIQQALSRLDASKAKKIKFSDAEEDDELSMTAEKLAKPLKTDIFGSDDETENNANYSLELKPEYFGKKGEKLLQMQSKQSLDPRFRIDAKFVDDEKEEDHHNLDNSVDPDEERNWQLGILEQVVGTKLNTENVAQKAAKNKKMLRFDPSNHEHQQYFRSNQDKSEETDTKNKNESNKTKLEKETTLNNEVSKQVFYVVTDTLKQSLKTRGDGFSLLNMFGKEEHLEQREEQLQKVSNKKIPVNNLEKAISVNPFHYDSSSESENEETVEESSTAESKKNGKKNNTKIVMETFFIPKNDVRLKEGAKFFKHEKNNETVENYENVRNNLKLLIKTKIVKCKKKLISFKKKH